MSRLSLRLLGGFEVQAKSEPVTIPMRKAQALLAYPALTPGQAHPRDKLAALLAWLSEARILADRVSEAREAADAAVTLATRHGERGHLAWALWARARTDARVGDWQHASRSYEEAGALAAELDMEPLIARGRLGLETVEARAP